MLRTQQVSSCRRRQVEWLLAERQHWGWFGGGKVSRGYWRHGEQGALEMRLVHCRQLGARWGGQVPAVALQQNQERYGPHIEPLHQGCSSGSLAPHE
jgi:hypothetical protein